MQAQIKLALAVLMLYCFCLGVWGWLGSPGIAESTVEQVPTEQVIGKSSLVIPSPKNRKIRKDRTGVMDLCGMDLNVSLRIRSCF